MLIHEWHLLKRICSMKTPIVIPAQAGIQMHRSMVEFPGSRPAPG